MGAHGHGAIPFPAALQKMFRLRNDLFLILLITHYGKCDSKGFN
jgi:hypothetical protein